MHIRSKVLSGVAAIALFATAPALAQSAPAPAAPAAAPTASAPAQTDSSAAMSTSMHKHKRVHHRMSKKSASTDTSAEDSATAQLNQQQLSNPGSTAAPSTNAQPDATNATNMPASNSGTAPNGDSTTPNTPPPDSGTSSPH